MKVKNYEWNGFGFPVVFDELPAVKLRGEVVPDIQWETIATPLVQHICLEQDVPMSGNQVKFMRMHLGMNLRSFAKFMGVTHQSVMRWEKQAKASAHMEAHVEFVLRFKILKELNCDQALILKAMDQWANIAKMKSAQYKQFRAINISMGQLRKAV